MGLRGLAGLGAFVLAASILVAFRQSPFWPAFDRIVAEPWGIVTLIDLYLAFFLVLILVAWSEPDRRIAALVCVLTPFLGSLVPAVWLVARFPIIRARMIPRDR